MINGNCLRVVRVFYCKPCNAIPPDVGAKQFAENIGKFFVQKVLDIRKRLDNIHSTCEHETSIPDVAPLVQDIREFDKLTENEVKLIMQRYSLRSCLMDPMPSWLVNQCDVLLPILTTLINTSLQTGEFPKAYKEALVLPLLKKPGPCFSELPKLSGPISGATNAFISSQRRGSKSSNFSICFVFLILKTCKKISFSKQADCS